MSSERPTAAARLRSKHIDDMADDFRWSHDPYLIGVNAWGPPHSFPDFRRTWLREPKIKAGQIWRYSIVDGRDVHIGNASIEKQNDQTCTIGLFIANEGKRRQGVGKRIVRQLVDIARRELKFQDVHAYVIPENLPAYEFFSRINFVNVGLYQAESGLRWVFVFVGKPIGDD